MRELNFDTGLVTFTVNKKCDVRFNPTDTAFVERLFAAFDKLDGKQEKHKDKIEAAKGNRAIFDVARGMDAEMRSIINSVFAGEDVCTPVFGDMNVYALSEGLPVWCNFLLAIMDEIDTSYTREQKLTNPRIAKYTARYKK